MASHFSIIKVAKAVENIQEGLIQAIFLSCGFTYFGLIAKSLSIDPHLLVNQPQGGLNQDYKLGSYVEPALADSSNTNQCLKTCWD